MNSLALQRLKLFSELDTAEVVTHSAEKYYTAALTEGAIFMLNEAFLLRNTLTDVDESSLFHTSGYIAFKEALAVKNTIEEPNFFKIQKFCYH